MKTEIMFKKIHAWEHEQSEFCKEIHAEIKNLCGNTHKVVFDKPIEVYGDYKEFSEVAVIDGILMSRNANGWCDKPIQPYYANWEAFMCMNAAIERNKYHLDDNEFKDHKAVVCV